MLKCNHELSVKIGGGKGVQWHRGQEGHQQAHAQCDLSSHRAVLLQGVNSITLLSVSELNTTDLVSYKQCYSYTMPVYGSLFLRNQ